MPRYKLSDKCRYGLHDMAPGSFYVETINTRLGSRVVRRCKQCRLKYMAKYMRAYKQRSREVTT